MLCDQVVSYVYYTHIKVTAHIKTFILLYGRILYQPPGFLKIVLCIVLMFTMLRRPYNVGKTWINSSLPWGNMSDEQGRTVLA